MKTPHVHDFGSLKIEDIVADNPNYSIAERGTWSFLTRYCSCGSSKAIEMIRRQKAIDRLEQLIN